MRLKPQREPGIHVSDIIKFMKERLGYDKNRAGGWDLETTWRIGLLFEEALALAFQDANAPSIGAFLKDGIWLTPDGYDPRERKIHEYKVTWRSLSKFAPEDDFAYQTQIKSYCHAVGVNKAVLWVLFLMGDYKGTGPKLLQFDLEYSQHELESNWQMLINNAKAMTKGEK